MIKPLALTLVLGLGALTTAAWAAPETVIYRTGFEAPTFHTGPVGHSYNANDGQDGWYAAPRDPYTSVPSPYVTVTDQFAYSGSQSLQFIQSAQTSVIGGTAGAWRNLGTSAVTLNSPTDPFRLSMNLYFDQPANSDLPWSLGLNTGGGPGLGMTFMPNNKIVYGHTLMNTAATYTPVFDMKNTWLSVAIERDPNDYTALLLSVSGRGQTWQQQVSSPGGAMSYVSFGAVMPTFPVAPYGVTYLDNFQLGYNLAPVPEPSGMALTLVAVGGLLMLQRRRPRA